MKTLKFFKQPYLVHRDTKCTSGHLRSEYKTEQGPPPFGKDWVVPTP